MICDYGFVGEQLMGLFCDVNCKQLIFDVILCLVEWVKQWKEYWLIFISDVCISCGVDFWNKYVEDLVWVEKEYGVLVEIIVLIIGVEIFFGCNIGSYWVMDVLFIFGFDYLLWVDFFCKELCEFFLFVCEQQVDLFSLIGFYVGVMGLL